MLMLRHPIALLLVTVAVLLGVLRSYSVPAPVDAGAPDVVFSAYRAEAILRDLLSEKVPHVAGSAANRAVRDRIVAQLEAAGYRPQIQSRFHCSPRYGSCSPVDNIIAVKSGSVGRYATLLTAHYDSTWGGPGAADDGAGVAALLEIARMAADFPAFDNDVIFLVSDSEETGLVGALHLDPQLLRGAKMLNLDTEEWQELYIGCAGGGGWELTREFATAAAPGGSEHWQLDLRGLAGGHSGIQIHEQLGNAIKLLGQCLREIEGVRLQHFTAGVAHNVIPREGVVCFACPPGTGVRLRERLEALREQWLSYLPEADRGVTLTLEAGSPGAVLGEEDSRTVLGLVAALPHGAQAYNLAQRADLVDLSVNLAVLRLAGGGLFVESSFRFFSEPQSVPLQQTLLAVADAFGMAVHPVVGYPGWRPDFDSPLLRQASALHERLFGRLPAVKAIHAGLECGILKSKKPDMDILSFGPTIRGAHSPTERMLIETVAPFWQFLTALLAEI